MGNLEERKKRECTDLMGKCHWKGCRIFTTELTIIESQFQIKLIEWRRTFLDFWGLRQVFKSNH